MDNAEFCCKGKKLADYLVKHGSKLLRVYRENGTSVFVFKHDESIGENLERWEADKKRCLFF